MLRIPHCLDNRLIDGVRLSALGTLEIYVVPKYLSVYVEDILKHILCSCFVVFKATEQKTKRIKIIILCKHFYIVVYSVHVLSTMSIPISGRSGFVWNVIRHCFFCSLNTHSSAIYEYFVCISVDHSLMIITPSSHQ
jgi:hypothetical protein